MANTLILGLGNPFRGDDGVGPAIVSTLREKRFAPDVEIIDGGTPGLETILIWRGYQRVIVVDAADMGLQPGQWRRFLPGEANLPIISDGMRGSLHTAGLAEALALAEALDMLPPELIFYGIQPANINWTLGLSAAVQSAVTAVCESILLELSTLSGYGMISETVKHQFQEPLDRSS